MTMNNRRFERIAFEADISLTLNHQVEPQTGQLVDISLNGALIHIPTGYEGVSVSDSGQALIIPEGTSLSLMATVEVAYLLSAKQLIGVNFLELDIDTASHIKRLVEMNLGASALQRELTSLIEAHTKVR